MRSDIQTDLSGVINQQGEHPLAKKELVRGAGSALISEVDIEYPSANW